MTLRRLRRRPRARGGGGGHRAVRGYCGFAEDVLVGRPHGATMEPM
jgi:hypothetical protein